MAKLEWQEFDQSGALIATYSKRDEAKELSVSVNIPFKSTVSNSDADLFQKPKVHKSILEKLFDVFLPAGYPASVTSDYLAYGCVPC